MTNLAAKTIAGLTPVDAGTAPRDLRDVYGYFPSGVVALCARVGGVATGMAASPLTSVSIDPPLVSVCIGRGSTTWPRLRTAGRLGISVLGESQGDACRRLGSRTGDRFDGLALCTTDAGAVFLDWASAWLDCTVHSELPAGDHDIVLLRIEALRAHPHVAPLVFHRSTFAGLPVPG